MDDIMKFSQAVTKELAELKSLGVAVSDGALKSAADLTEMAEYAASMSVGDCADLLMNLG